MFLYYIYALGCFGYRRAPEGLVPIIYVCVQKVVKNRWKTQLFVKRRFLLRCDRLLPFLYKQTLKIHLPGPPREAPF